MSVDYAILAARPLRPEEHALLRALYPALAIRLTAPAGALAAGGFAERAARAAGDRLGQLVEVTAPTSAAADALALAEALAALLGGALLVGTDLTASAEEIARRVANAGPPGGEELLRHLVARGVGGAPARAPLVLEPPTLYAEGERAIAVLSAAERDRLEGQLSEVGEGICALGNGWAQEIRSAFVDDAELDALTEAGVPAPLLAVLRQALDESPDGVEIVWATATATRGQGCASPKAIPTRGSTD